jgi:hypothetical protein
MFKVKGSIIMLVSLLSLGCASKPSDPREQLVSNMQVMRSAISNNVEDAERKQNLLLLTASLEQTLLEYNQSFVDFAVEFGKLNRDYATPREKLQELQASFRTVRASVINKVVDIHYQMVAQTTEDEWKKIVKKEIEALESVRQLPEDKLSEKS